MRYLALLVVSCVVASPATACELIASDFNGVLYDIDVDTGQASNARSGERLSGLIGISQGPDGFLYGLRTYAGSEPNSLYRIDPVSGVSYLIGPTGLTKVFEGDLDFDPVTGTLFTISNVPDLPLLTDVATIDTQSGAATVIGQLPTIGDFSAMAFSPDGTLYVLDSRADEFIVVDPGTAAISKRIEARAFASVAGMDFHPRSGDLFVVDGFDRVFIVDPDTGEDELIGRAGTPFGMAGLEFSSCPIEVAVDVAPGSAENPIRTSSHGVVPVAILGSETFSVTEVDVTTLAFGPGAAFPVHSAGGHFEDVSGDDVVDLVSHYRISEVGLIHDHDEVCVAGETFEGSAFEGCDTMTVIPRH